MVANHSCKAFEERVLGHGSLAWSGAPPRAPGGALCTLVTNAMCFAAPQGFNTADDFFNCLRDAFDVLYAEGDDTATMLFVCLHCRPIGRPGRFRALQHYLDHIEAHDRVRVTRRLDIARHWLEYHPLTTKEL